MRILLVSGSLRSCSYNKRLIDVLTEHLYGLCEVDVVAPAQIDLPIFNEDLEHDPALIERVKNIHHRFATCRGLIVANPEYNGQPSAYVKNIIDWVSRLAYTHPDIENPFLDKPVLLASASTGAFAGIVGLEHLASLLRYVGGLVMAGQVTLPYAHEHFEGTALAEDHFLHANIERALERFLHIAACLSRSSHSG